MKNKLSVLLVLCGLLLVGTGCSLGGLIGGDDSEKTAPKSESAEKSGDSSGDSSSSSSSGGKVLNSGVKECDDLAQYIEDNSEELEGNLLTKAIVYMYKNSILKQIEEGAKDMSEEDKKKLAEVCKKTHDQLKEKQ